MEEPSDLFTVDGSSGEIRTRAPLAFRADSGALSPDNAHGVVVVARDRGDPPLSSRAAVTVLVKPANQRAPEWSAEVYSAAVPETARVGTSVLTLSAV